MKHHIRKQLKFFTVLIMLLIPTFAWGQEWKIDATHSGIRFGVRHIFSTVWGHFSAYDGTIKFDPNALDQSRFDFTVEVKSINTLDGKRDNHLRSDDFFQADKFPVMGFTSSNITHKEGNHYIVTGILSLKETQKEMHIPFVYHGTTPSPFNKDQVVAGFDTEFVINRLDFGVGNGKFKEMGVVGEMVRIMITIEAIGKK